jgi:hypothetical protein
MKRAKRFQSGGIARCGLLICGVLAATGALGQSGGSGITPVPCLVNYLRVRIATGADNLRGWDGRSSSKDNLDITVYFGENGSQLAPDVNNNQEWKNNTTHMVEIKLNPAVSINDITDLKLRHTGLGFGISAETASPVPGAGVETADNWDMDWIEVMAEGTGASARIAAHGAKRFTDQDRVLDMRTEIPANSCEVDERVGRLNPGARNVQPTNGTGSKYGRQRSAPSAIQAASESGSQPFKNNRLIQQAIAHTVQIGPRASSATDESYTAKIAILKRQSAAARSLLLPAVRPVAANNSGPLLGGGTAQMLNPQPYPPKASSPQIGAAQPMSATGTPAATGGSAAMMSHAQSGPSAHRPPSSPEPQTTGAMAPLPTQLCKAGIATVDGGASGVWFSPVPGQDGRFVIQGCGFGTTAGQVYLSGVQFDPAYARLIVQRVGVSTSPDRVYFQVPANEWSDRQIVAQIDASASGLYDTNNVTLNVITASGNTYQAAGMIFLAARADQVLSWIVPPPSGYSSFVVNTAFVTNPTAVVHLAAVADSTGNLILPTISSPSTGTSWSAESVGTIRAKLGQSTPSKVTFPGGTDDYQLNLAPGFQLDPPTGVQMRHTQIDVNQCQQSFKGDYLSNGSWAINYTSKTAFQISWQEQSCWPKAGTQGLSPGDYGSISVYALQVTVLGPRGVSPWGNGNLNPLTIKQGTNTPLLLGH